MTQLQLKKCKSSIKWNNKSEKIFRATSVKFVEILLLVEM